MTPNDDEKIYSTADTAYAAGISVDTLKNWVSRKPPMLLLDERADKGGRGNPIRYSFARVLQIAIAAELIANDVHHRRAAAAALAFTDTSAGSLNPGGFVGEDEKMDLSGLRLPTKLFPKGLTYLVVPPGDPDDGINADVVNVTMETPAVMLLRGGMTGRSGASSAVIVEVNGIHRRVCAKLTELHG